jgi:hypothetical protein
VKSFQSQTFYELLEVSVGATPGDIRSAFERLSRLYADDQVALYGLIDEARAKALRGRLQEAADVLLDDERRASYDASIGLPPREGPKKVPAAPVVSPPPPSGWSGAFTFVTSTPAVAAPVSTSFTYTVTAPVEVTRRPASPKAASAPEVDSQAPGLSSALAPMPQAAPVAPPLEPTPVAGSAVGRAPPTDAGAPAVPADALGSPSPGAPDQLEAEASARPGPAAMVSAAAGGESLTSTTVKSPSVEGAKAAAPLPAAIPEAIVSASSEPVIVAASAPPFVESPAGPLPGSDAPTAGATVGATEPPQAVTPPAPSEEGRGLADEPRQAESRVAPARSTESAEASAPPASEQGHVVAHEPAKSEPPAPSTEREAAGMSVVPGAAFGAAVGLPPPASVTTEAVVPTLPVGEPGPAAASEPLTSLRPVDPPVADDSAIVPTRPFTPREYRPPERPRPYEVPAGVEFNGDLLRQVRMARGLSLLQLSERTRIGVRHLENLESDRYDALPALVYLRGMLMNVARELGLDGLRVSKSYLTFVEAHQAKAKG